MKKILLLLLLSSTLSARQIRTAEYAALQERVCSGWNTWYNNSVTSFTLLPQGYAITLGFATEDNRNYLNAFIKQTGGVTLGLRANDGSYTSMTLQWQGIDVLIESATDGDDELILVTPQTQNKHLMVVDASILYGRSGTVGLADGKLTFGDDITVTPTRQPVDAPYIICTAPHLTFQLTEPVGLCTGRERTLVEVQGHIAAARATQQAAIDSRGDLAEMLLPMQTILSWNTIYDPASRRAITPVSRDWNRYWGGFVLFPWDTFFASHMFSAFHTDMAIANAVEMTKAITSEGFLPNYQSVSGFFVGAPSSSWDRSQPPVGSNIVMQIYRARPERWFLEEVYPDLLTWNRWWHAERRTPTGGMTWGSYAVHNEETHCAGKQGALWESGLDNSPMYDECSFDEQTHLLTLDDVGLMSLYIADCNALAQMATILGNKADAKELTARAKQYTRALQGLWDEDSGIFRNRHTDTGRLSEHLSPTNFYPMLARACTAKQAKRMVDEHLLNPDEFWGEWVIPTIARNDPGYPDQAYWRGRIWGPTNYLVYMGLRNYDNVRDARQEFVQKSAALLLKGWRDGGCIWENFHADTGNGWERSSSPAYQNSDSFYHWGSLLTFLSLLEADECPGACEKTR